MLTLSDRYWDAAGTCVCWASSRNAWRDVAIKAGARIVEGKLISTEVEEHRRRVETQKSDVPGLALPDWQAVIGREYEARDRDPLRSIRPVAQSTLALPMIPAEL